jgi:hypothetical protein
MQISIVPKIPKKNIAPKILFFEKTQKAFAFHFIEKEREIGLLLQAS